MSTSREHHDTIERAAGYVRAAANLLDSLETSAELFCPARVMATQLALIAAGLGSGRPTAALCSTPETTSPARHVDRALMELDAAIDLDSPAELLVWTARLRELRPQLATLTTRR